MTDNCFQTYICKEIVILILNVQGGSKTNIEIDWSLSNDVVKNKIFVGFLLFLVEFFVLAVAAMANHPYRSLKNTVIITTSPL